MQQKFVFAIIVMSLLAACTQPPGIQIPITPTGPGAYPGPLDPTQPMATLTPSGDDPVSSDDPAPESPYPSPLEPIPGEENMVRGEVFIESTDILILESFPIQVMVSVSGSLPTPCHNLRAEIAEPDEQNRIMIDLHSLADPEQICIQVLQPFESSLPLGSFEAGTYSVWVNGEEIGEFTT